MSVALLQWYSCGRCSYLLVSSHLSSVLLGLFWIFQVIFLIYYTIQLFTSFLFDPEPYWNQYFEGSHPLVTQTHRFLLPLFLPHVHSLHRSRQNACNDSTYCGERESSSTSVLLKGFSEGSDDSLGKQNTGQRGLQFDQSFFLIKYVQDDIIPETNIPDQYFSDKL